MGNSYQEIKYRETQELKQKAHVAPVVKPAQHFTTEAGKRTKDFKFSAFFLLGRSSVHAEASNYFCIASCPKNTFYFGIV